MSHRKRGGGAADWDSYAAFYDWENTRTFGRRDIRWWTQFLPRAGRVLELGSGTGRLIIPLARSGAEMTGIDFSSAMIERARRRASRLPAGQRPTLIRGDMRGAAGLFRKTVETCDALDYEWDLAKLELTRMGGH